METNRSWSIDDKRYNFQFGCEIAWEIRDGKRVRMLKNPTYSGITTEFWNSCAGHRQSRSLGAVGRSELRQGTAGAGDRHRPRRKPRAFPRHQGGSRVCRLNPETPVLSMDECRRDFRRVQRAAKSFGVADVEALFGAHCGALTRFANNTIHQNVAEQDRMDFGARATRSEDRARHHQSLRSRFHPLAPSSRPLRLPDPPRPIPICCRSPSPPRFPKSKRFDPATAAADPGASRVEPSPKRFASWKRLDKPRPAFTPPGKRVEAIFNSAGVAALA